MVKGYGAFQGLVTQMPAAALVEPGGLLSSLTEIFSFLDPLTPISRDSFHVLTILCYSDSWASSPPALPMLRVYDVQ